MLVAMALWSIAGALVGGHLTPPITECNVVAEFGLPLLGFAAMLYGRVFSYHTDPTVRKGGIALTILGIALPWIVPVFFVLMEYTCLPEILAGGV